MKGSITPKFLHHIRIRGGEFDASARAMHRKAAVENVSVATIERISMSTKTTFKRIALVAVAALGIGLLSAVPSNAAPVFSLGTFGTQTGGATTTINQVVGGQASTVVALDVSKLTNIAVSGVGSVVSSTAVNFTSTRAAGSISWTDSTTATTSPTDTIVIGSSVAGVTTITATPLNGDGSPGTTVTQTITWGSAVVPTLNSSTAFISTTTTSPATVDSTPLSVPAAVTGTAYARITVNQYSTTDTTTPLLTANSTAVVVSISGAGALANIATPTVQGASISVAAGASTGGVSEFYVYPNGVAGVGTITVSVNGAVTSTKSVTFAGVLASYVVGTPSNTLIGIGKTGTVVITGKDTNGNAATLGAITVTSGTPAVATVATSGGTITITGVAVGTSVITVANASTSPTITATFTVTVGKVTAKTVTMTFDKASYAPGAVMVLTVTAMGSDGTAVGDGALAVFGSTGVTANVLLQGDALPGASVTFTGGVKTFNLYAPLASGTINLTAVEGVGTDNVIAGGTAATITASADVVGDTTAVDAANAATDAANYAADAADAATTAAEEATAAAQAAQDSADAASAAVVALGLRVAVLYAATRTQVLRLQNLLVRLIKKLHA
jgi:hypothetical protein